MKYPREWEKIDASGRSYRLKVYGGWIVRSVEIYSGCSIHNIFIADSAHQWQLE